MFEKINNNFNITCCCFNAEKPSQTYYIKGTVGVGLLVGRPHLMVVAPDVAEQEIIKCKLIPEKKKE